ncbi:hypothetical protein WDU94_011846 [Cyamophila willieti]
MPTTKSARKSLEEATETVNFSPSPEKESQSDTDLTMASPNSDKCLSCKEKYDHWFQDKLLNITDKCPCILSVCQSCGDESKDDEYCFSGQHLDAYHFLEKEMQSQLQNINKEDPDSGIELPFTFQGKNMIYHGQLKSEDTSKIPESSNEMSGNIYHIYINYSAGSSFHDKSSENFKRQPVVMNTEKDRFPPHETTKKSLKLPPKYPISYKYIAVAIVLASIAIFLARYRNHSKETSSNVPITDEAKMIAHVFEQVKSLESKYTKQSRDLWGTLRQGMRNLVKNSKRTMTILLLHSENTTVDTCFLRDIKKIANDVVEYHMRRKADESNGVAITDTNEVASVPKPRGVIIDMETNSDVFDNPGVFMEKYKSQLEQEKLMIVVNFHKSSLNVMQAFHFLADGYDPYISNVLILLTLEVKNKNFDVAKKVEKIAEHELADLLESLPDNKRDPLITRLTENVYMISVEQSMVTMSCSLS